MPGNPPWAEKSLHSRETRFKNGKSFRSQLPAHKRGVQGRQGVCEGFPRVLSGWRSGSISLLFLLKKRKKQDWKEVTLSFLLASSQEQFNKTDTSVTPLILKYSNFAIQLHHICKFREMLSLDEVLIRRIFKDSTWSTWTVALMNYSHSSVCDSLGIFCWFIHYKVEAIWKN